MPRLTEAVVLRGPDGVPEPLLAGSEVPEWAIGKIGPHLITDDVNDKPAGEAQGEAPAKPAARAKK